MLQEKVAGFCCEVPAGPHLPRLVGRDYGVAPQTPLGCFANFTNEVVVGCYELRVVICNYQMAQ